MKNLKHFLNCFHKHEIISHLKCFPVLLSNFPVTNGSKITLYNTTLRLTKTFFHNQNYKNSDYTDMVKQLRQMLNDCIRVT